MADYGRAVRFGVFVTPSNAEPEAVVALAVLAEEVGLDLVTFQDHPYQPRFLDTWTLLAYVAARTERVQLAPNVLNLPLRPPAIVARSVASLDLLSRGRVELGIGSGAFWDAIEGLGARRLRPGQSVDALEEAIDLIRALWAVDEADRVSFEGEHYRLTRAHRGPAPAHEVEIWIGAYKPRMLALTGRKGDGWLPSLSYLEPGQLGAGNAAIDAAAVAAGRKPAEIRRQLNVPADLGVDELARLALEDGIDTFIVAADDPATIRALAGEIAPAVRERVAAGRAAQAVSESSADAPPAGAAPGPATVSSPAAEPASAESPGPMGQHLIDVHDMLRRELVELRAVVAEVRAGALSVGEARSALNEMALRQNDWTLGAFCARYCRVVVAHHSLEDEAVFPHLGQSEPALRPVIDKLTEEHLVIHDAIEAVDQALVEHLKDPEDFTTLQAAIDRLSDTLLEHLAYEERELVGPLDRLGFYPGQV